MHSSVKNVSKVLFYITRTLSFAYFAMAFLSAIALGTGWGLSFSDNKKYFHILYPFTSQPMLNGDYNSTYIFLYFLTPIILYGLFFLLASNVFKAFFQPRLFTQYGIKHLRRFYLGNLVIPGVVLLSQSIFDEVDEATEILVAVHFILGVFAYFLAAIFKQGLNLQNEQDLII